MNAKDIPEAIEWHEGLLLTPQHFQQLSLRQEALLHYAATRIAPFGWGVRDFEVDDDDLREGKLSVKRVEAVMPDSLVVSYDRRRDEGELSVALDAEEMKEGPVAVHLAVPARQTGAAARGDGARYRSVEGDPVADESTGEGQLMIPRLRPRLSLRIKDMPSKKYDSFPLAMVEYRDESFVLTDYIPPTLSVSRESALGAMCSDVARRLRAKASSLALRSKGPGRSGYDLATENLLRSLVTPLPLLEGVLHAGVTHPHQVYLALLSVVGHVSLLGGDPVPERELARYDHDDLRATFGRAIEFIKLKIEEGATSSFTPYIFSRKEDVYSLAFEGAWANRRLALGMRAPIGMTEHEVVRWGNECLIGSRTKMQRMRETRVLGAWRRPAGPDEFFVPPRGVVLFSLKADREFIEPDEVLQIYNRGDRGGRPAEIVLYVSNTA